MTKVLGHLQSNVIAYVALFVALGGTGYAAVNLPKDSVGTNQLKNHSVTPIKLDRGSIAGYVRAYVQINAQGRVTASRPAARLIAWQSAGSPPGGLIQWSQQLPAACFAEATAEIQLGSASSASAQFSGGTRAPAQAYVFLSAPNHAVNVAIICPQS
jgi:hypothetical protein